MLNKQNEFPSGDTDCQIPDNREAEATTLQKKTSLVHFATGQLDNAFYCRFPPMPTSLGTKSALKVSDSSDDTDKRCQTKRFPKIKL